MKEFSGYFNGKPGQVLQYIDAEFAKHIMAMVTDGVAGATALKVLPVAGAMKVKIDYGLAIVQGTVYALEYDGGAAHTVSIGAAGTAPRIDRVVLRLHKADAKHSIMVLAGAPGTDPQPPELTRTGGVYDLSLAAVRVEPGVVEVAADKILDERIDESVCGYICATGLKRSDLKDAHVHDLATSSKAGFMSKEDKAKLDGSISQGLKPTDSPTFAGVTATGNVSVGGTLTVNGVIQGARFE